MRRLRDILPLALILLLALTWRLLLWSQPPHQPANDEVEYVRVAQDLLAGRGWAFYESWRWLRAPLYPLFLAGSLALASLDAAATLAEVLHRAALGGVLLSLGVVSLIYRLARELTPGGRSGPALIAAAIAALLQTNATFASLYMSETLFNFLLSWGLLTLAAWRRLGGGWRATGAGILLGLACLTRSAALAFLPVAALWMAGITARRARGPLPVIAAPLAMILGATAVIAPWTLRNCHAYGRCVLIETGGSYNLWAFYEPHESLEEINQALEAIPNPIDRADEASRRGLARLREDPSMVLRKIPAEWTRLWAVKPIEDRFLLTSAYSDPAPAIFLAGLALDDLLYLAILCAAPFGLGLALTRRDALGLLLGLWVASIVGATLITHAEGRYRHFLFLALIPLAALSFDALWRRARRRPAHAPDAAGTPHPALALTPTDAAGTPHPALTLAATLALTLALLPLVYFYPWEWATSGALRSLHRLIGDQHAAAGRTEAAALAYRAALGADETPDGWIVLGDLWRRAGDRKAAAKAYEQAHLSQQTYVGASATWGDMLRELGRDAEAREAFRGTYLDQQRLADWGFQMLRPAPAAAVDLGDGLDIGYVGGFYQAEDLAGATARWTDGRGRLRLTPSGQGEQVLVTLRAAALRPDGAAVPLQVCAAGACQELSLGPPWRVARVLLPPAAADLELRSPTFHASDGRDLGVLIDWATVEALTPR